MCRFLDRVIAAIGSDGFTAWPTSKSTFIAVQPSAIPAERLRDRRSQHAYERQANTYLRRKSAAEGRVLMSAEQVVALHFLRDITNSEEDCFEVRKVKVFDGLPDLSELSAYSYARAGVAHGV